MVGPVKQTKWQTDPYGGRKAETTANKKKRSIIVPNISLRGLTLYITLTVKML